MNTKSKYQKSKDKGSSFDKGLLHLGIHIAIQGATK